MLYSVIICIAYIIGIIWGLYLDLYLGIVSFFLCVCGGLNLIYFLKSYFNKNRDKNSFDEQDIHDSKNKVEIKNKEYNENKIFTSAKKEINKIILIVLISFLFGYINTSFKLNNFQNKYSSRSCFCKGRNLKFNRRG